MSERHEDTRWRRREAFLFHPLKGFLIPSTSSSRLAGPQWCQCWRFCVPWFQRGSFHVGVLGCASVGGLCLLFLTSSSLRRRLQVSFSARWSPWRHSVFVGAMTTRRHSKSRSPAKRDVCRMSQTSTIAASSQPVPLMLTPTPARADLPDAQLPALPQSPGAPLEDITTPIQASLHAQSSGPTYRGDPPQPAPAPVSGLLRLFTSRMLTPLRVHALPLFSLAWLLLFCPTRDRHLLRPRSLPSVMATTGAASALAEVSPPSLVSCAMSRTSTRAPLWTRPPAPCSRRSNE